MLEEESLLREWYRPHNERLFRLLGRDLGWSSTTRADGTITWVGDTAASGHPHLDTPVHRAAPTLTFPVEAALPYDSYSRVYGLLTSADACVVSELFVEHGRHQDVNGSYISLEDANEATGVNNGTVIVHQCRPQASSTRYSLQWGLRRGKGGRDARARSRHKPRHRREGQQFLGWWQGFGVVVRLL